MKTTFYIDNCKYYAGWPHYGTCLVATDTPENAVIAFTLLNPKATIRRVLFKNENNEYEEIEV